MNATNRFANRIVLFIAAVVLVVAGAALFVIGAVQNGIRADWISGLSRAMTDVWSIATRPTIDVAGIGVVPVAAVIAAAVVVVVLVLLIVFLSTRGGGRTADVWSADGADGRIAVDRSVADAVLGAPLRARPDVVSAQVSAWMIRGRRALELSVRVQPTARLDAVVAAAEQAVDVWDGLLDARTPVVLHLSDRSWRDAFRPRTRVS
ncbi:hypothetical protein [Microbacterium sp. H83]|uniref:hypothetical protein n=1 Tax=Microbacterium sp. H83 TaxID=1827324 RepID=UPI0007F3EFA2|nr:hypothetical protein [Microbacterium sp. H83]OAN35190.1 hypothetical protein A4X16_04865 [Microbacterium sp. H83]